MKTNFIRLLFLLALSAAARSGNAQDLLYFKNGNVLTVNITEINQTSVKYKRFENPNGPTLVVTRRQLVKVVYKNGTSELFADTTRKEDVIPNRLKYSGPRVGFTYLSPGSNLNHLADAFNRQSISPIITQFGWQFETRFFTTQKGSSGLVELIPMIGGLEQGLFVPSVTGILGYRHYNGFEFGIGPSISLNGTSVVFAAGTSFHSESVVFPVNLAFVPSISRQSQGEYIMQYDPNTGMYNQIWVPGTIQHTGFRLTLTVGFNSRTY